MASVRFEPASDLVANVALRLPGRGSSPAAAEARARGVAGLVTALGALPAPNRWVEVNARTLLWLGPDEVLVISQLESGPDLAEMLRTAGAGAAVDLTSNWVGFDLAGPGAREVLASGCAIDFHPRAFTVGAVAQTLMANVAITIWQRSDEPHYRILVRPSFSRHLAGWIADAVSALD